MILHLVINCDPWVDRQIHSYLIIACISDSSVKSDLKFYFMGICKDINTQFLQFVYGPRQANLVLIAYANSGGSGEPAHPRSLARTFAARSYKQ